MDFVDKKEDLSLLIEKYIEDKSNENELIMMINELSDDEDFKSKDLFRNIFNELKNSISELSNKELRQRVLMIKSYID
jgi:hypothetical protein